MKTQIPFEHLRGVLAVFDYNFIIPTLKLPVKAWHMPQNGGYSYEKLIHCTFNELPYLQQKDVMG